MDEYGNIQNGATPATVAAETTTETAVAAKPARKTATVIPARKVKKGKCGHKAGAPLKDIIGLSVNRRKGIFTKKDIFEANGQTISELCIDQRLKRLAKAKELFKLAAGAKAHGSGRPPLRYTFDAAKAAELKPARKSRKVAAEAIPTVPVENTEAVVHPETAPETPAVVETPAAPAPETAV